jgi:hypothetical protein
MFTCSTSTVSYSRLKYLLVPLLFNLNVSLMHDIPCAQLGHSSNVSVSCIPKFFL